MTVGKRDAQLAVISCPLMREVIRCRSGFHGNNDEAMAWQVDT
jgi:hypothetical protein